MFFAPKKAKKCPMRRSPKAIRSRGYLIFIYHREDGISSPADRFALTCFCAMNGFMNLSYAKKAGR
jgi:hypothetical protein